MEITDLQIEECEKRQSLPKWMRVLSSKEILKLNQYKHKTEKSPLEEFLSRNILQPWEKMWPSFLTANSITLMGQIPICCWLLVIFATHGLNISPDKPLPSILAFGCGCTIFWFTMVDMVDGIRARRTGCGSPLGRLVDEG